MAVPIYIPINHVWRFQLLQSSPIQLLTVFLIKAILMGVKWYHIAVLICLCLMANNVVFSQAHWPFVWFWQNVFLYPLPIFSVGFFVFSLLSCKCCLYILNLIRYVICKYFLTFCGSLFTLLMVVLWNTSFKFWWRPIYVFFLLLHVLWYHIGETNE